MSVTRQQRTFICHPQSIMFCISASSINPTFKSFSPSELKCATINPEYCLTTSSGTSLSTNMIWQDLDFSSYFSDSSIRYSYIFLYFSGSETPSFLSSSEDVSSQYFLFSPVLPRYFPTVSIIKRHG